jgi:hypothetical protein
MAPSTTARPSALAGLAVVRTITSFRLSPTARNFDMVSAMLCTVAFQFNRPMSVLMVPGMMPWSHFYPCGGELTASPPMLSLDTHGGP